MLSRELQRATSENNALHQEVIATKQAADVKQREHAVAERAAGALKQRFAEVAQLQLRYQQGLQAPGMHVSQQYVS